MGGSDYTSSRYSDRYYRDRDYRHHDDRRHHARDSRDSYRSDYHQRRVPGLVSDPDRQLGDVESAIQRGQRETISRVQSDRYSPIKNKNALDDSANGLQLYHPSPMTVTQNFHSSSLRGSQNNSLRKKLYNPGFLSFLPGLAGLALIITAIVLVAWTTATSLRPSSNEARIDYKGLFHVCTTAISSSTILDQGCVTTESFANAGTYLTKFEIRSSDKKLDVPLSATTCSVTSNLEQATRAMMIISAIIAFVSSIVSFLLGLNKLERPKGALISGGLHAFAGACGTAGMGCYSAVLVENTTSSSENGVSFVLAGTSFYLGWVGTGLLFIASITSFLGHGARWKKK